MVWQRTQMGKKPTVRTTGIKGWRKRAPSRRPLVLGVLILLAALYPGQSTQAADERGGGNCMSISQIRRTSVIDDRTVLFYLGGDRIRKMTLAFDCPSLSFHRSFSRKDAKRLEKGRSEDDDQN